MRNQPLIIRLGAVASSLALASTFVWYQARGKARLMPGSKSTGAAASALHHEELFQHTEYDPNGALEYKSPDRFTITVIETEEEKREHAATRNLERRDLMYSSKSGAIFVPEPTPRPKKDQRELTDYEFSQPWRSVPGTLPPAPAPAPAQRRAIMPSTKSMVIDLDRPPASPPPARPVQPQQQQVQQPRRVLLPGSKSKAFTE